MSTCACGCGQSVTPGRRYVLGHNPHGRRSELAPCGTYGGYQRHTRTGERPCEPCREANRAYMAAYRNTNPAYAALNAAQNAARSRALWRLADRYPRVFQRFYEAEMRREEGAV